MRYDALANLVDEVPQLVALKDNTSYIEKFARTVKVLGRKISVLNGPEEPQEPYISQMGAKGFVTGEACLIPKTCLKIYEEEVNGNNEYANEILDEAFPLPNFLLSVRTWCILYC